MNKYRVLYNPYAGGGKGLTESRKLCDMLPECELDFCDITGIESYDAFLHRFCRMKRLSFPAVTERSTALLTIPPA